MKLISQSSTRSGIPWSSCRCSCSASEPSEFVTAPFAKGENGTISPLYREKICDGDGEDHLERQDRQRGKAPPARTGGRAPYAAALAAELLSCCNSGARHRAALGRALRRAPDEAVDKCTARRRKRTCGKKRELERRIFSSRRNAAACVSMPRATRLEAVRLGPHGSFGLHRHPLLPHALLLLLVCQRVD